MIGKTLAHYKILEKLGEGGMGEVYLAHDTELGRKVALKVLRSDTAQDLEQLERFKREARAVAALNHPSIVTIHSVEAATLDDEGASLHFLTMELVDGTGLDRKIPPGGLPRDRIFELAVPLADALAAAHKSGITHRDLKPANVMLTADGRVKILDFGLAKLAEDDGPEQDTTQALTQPGLVMGTIPYMSPEQVSGEPVDHRTDIFALGVILYEMATGRRPFAAENSSHLISSILRDDPPSVTEIRTELPFHLGRIIRRCLEKDPDRRYQSALDVRNELETLRDEVQTGVVSAVSEAMPVTPGPRARPRWLGAAIAAAAVVIAGLAWLSMRGDEGPDPGGEPSTAGSRAVVVLPFENLGPPEDEYFAAGITEEITSRLATMAGVRVISRNSAIRYAGTDKTLQQIGEELDVDHVLEGSIRWARGDDGSRVRITPRLTRVSDDTQIWSEAYDKVFADVFEVQTEIADRVTERLGSTLLEGSDEDTVERPTANADAYQAYLRALDNLRGSTLEEFQLAYEMLHRAVELDPTFAQAWGRLAWMSSQRYFNGDFRENWLAVADEAIARALELDPDDPLVRLAEGFYHYYGHRRFEHALAIFERVVEDQPNSSEALSAVGYIYRRQGKFEPAIDQLRRALALDPQNVDLMNTIAETLGALRRFDEQVAMLDRALSIAPDRFNLYFSKANAQALSSGRTEAARATLEAAPSGDFNYQTWIQLEWLDRDFEAALARIEAQPVKSPFDEINLPIQRGMTYQMMGEDERARPVLEGAVASVSAMIDSGPAEPGLLIGRGVLQAALGNREASLVDLERAIEMTRSDHFAGPRALESKVIALGFLGETDAAIDLLEGLLERSYSTPVTRTSLAQHPIWDPLRANPRFDRLTAAG